MTGWRAAAPDSRAYTMYVNDISAHNIGRHILLPGHASLMYQLMAGGVVDTYCFGSGRNSYVSLIYHWVAGSSARRPIAGLIH